MEHTHTEAHGQHGHDSSTKAIWKTFWILLAITVFEVSLAFIYLEHPFMHRLALNAVFIILTIFKAFFIVANFMHLRNEIRNLIMTILIPLMLFIWFIIAFLADGDSWKNMRKDLAPGTPAPVEHVAPAEEAHH